MVLYRKALPEEMPEILDFINMVFSMAHYPHDFRNLLPKLYGEGKEEKSTHYIAVEDGSIKAAVCMLPVTLCHGDSRIVCGTIGSVSVHPYSRKSGHMRQLMKLAVSDMEKDGICMSSLSGRRQRYQYYGYELGGYYYRYRFIPDNFRHCAAKYDLRNLCLEEVTDCQSPYLPEMHRLSMERTVFSLRSSDDFFTVSQSWSSKLYAVLEAGSLQGYVSLNNNLVQEMCLKDSSLTFSCLQSCLEQTGEQELLLLAYPHDQKLMGEVSPFYESCSMHTDDNYQIFRFRETLQFFLDVKSECCRLESGSLDFSVQGHGAFRIAVRDGKACVSALEGTPEIVLTPLELISCMFSPEPGMRGRLLPEARNWFPLPLALYPLDKC